MILNLKKIPVIHLGWDKTIDGKPWYLAKYDPQHFEYLYDWYDIAVTDAEGYIFFIERQYSLTKGLQHTPYPATIYNDPPPPPYFAPPPPPPPPRIPPTKVVIDDIKVYIPFDYSNLEANLKSSINSTCYYEPETIIKAFSGKEHLYTTPIVDANSLSYEANPLLWMAKSETMGVRYSYSEEYRVPLDTDNDQLTTTDYDYHMQEYDYSGYPDKPPVVKSKLFNVLKLTTNLSFLDVEVRFNLFKDISVSRIIINDTINWYGKVFNYIKSDTLTTTITKTLYPYSIYLKSVSVVPDSIGKNGYDSVSLLNSTLDNRVYSVDIEGAPTTCDSGYIIKMQQVLNNSYYPNMKLSFNFVDSALNEFSYICDDPLVEISTPSSSVIVKIPKGSVKVTKANYIQSLVYCSYHGIAIAEASVTYGYFQPGRPLYDWYVNYNYNVNLWV